MVVALLAVFPLMQHLQRTSKVFSGELLHIRCNKIAI